MRLRLGLLLWFGLSAACSADDPLCTPGRELACTCATGAAGGQRCADDGARYLECICGSAPDAGVPSTSDGGSDAGSDTPEAASAIYLNWCSSGCTFTPGADDSRLNTTSLVSQTKVLSESIAVSALRGEVRTCLESLFAPYDVDVTEVDPGDRPHREVAVGTTSTAVGLPAGLGGIAPLVCDGHARAIVFAFGDMFAGDPRRLCENIAFQVGASVGLDVAFSCPDVMSYLTGCGAKTFVDAASECGEYGARSCACGRSVQNSHQLLLERLGARP